MKKIVSFMLALSCATLSLAHNGGESNGDGQGVRFTGGPIVEMNASGFIQSGISGGRSTMDIGANVGGFVDMEITDWFSVEGDLTFQYKSSDFEWTGESGRYKYWGVEIPMYAMLHLPLHNGGRISAGIGPYTNFGLDASYTVGGRKLDVYEKDKDTGLPAMTDTDTGFGIKLGYEFASGLQINVTYRISVTNVVDANSSAAKMHPQAMSVGVAYRFGKK